MVGQPVRLTWVVVWGQIFALKGSYTCFNLSSWFACILCAFQLTSERIMPLFHFLIHCFSHPLMHAKRFFDSLKAALLCAIGAVGVQHPDLIGPNWVVQTICTWRLERAQALTGMAALPPARAKRQWRLEEGWAACFTLSSTSARPSTVTILWRWLSWIWCDSSSHASPARQ